MYHRQYVKVTDVAPETSNCGERSVVLPPSILERGLPFKVYRQPVKSLATPLSLPKSTVIDLEGSGITHDNPSSFSSTLAGNYPVIVMFSPNGSVDEMYVGGRPLPVLAPIFLLVGKSKPVPPEAGDANWQDTENLWLTINPRTGMIATNQVVSGNSLLDSRALAREGQTMGGR